MVYELAELVASLGDSHTAAYPPEGLFNEALPAGFFGLGDKVYLSGYLEGYEQFEPYLLREIVAVNDVSMEYILEKLASVTDPAHAEGIAEIYTNGYLCPSLLDWAGCGYSEAYVLTGRITASAAIFCMSVFKAELGATVVGAPTGQFTKFFCPRGMNTDIVLPNSRITVQISGTWHEVEGLMEPVYDDEGKLYERENTVLPDVFVEQDIEDLRLGKDSLMEWVWRRGL